MRDHKKSLELIHYFQPPNTSNSNNVFFKKKKKKKKESPNLYPTGFMKIILFLVKTMNSLKEAFQNLRHHLVANYN